MVRTIPCRLTIPLAEALASRRPPPGVTYLRPEGFQPAPFPVDERNWQWADPAQARAEHWKLQCPSCHPSVHVPELNPFAVIEEGGSSFMYYIGICPLGKCASMSGFWTTFKLRHEKNVKASMRSMPTLKEGFVHGIPSASNQREIARLMANGFIGLYEAVPWYDNGPDEVADDHL